MDSILEVVVIAGLFLLRIGVPLVILVILGLAIDRWQNHRDEQIKEHYVVLLPKSKLTQAAAETTDDEEIEKAA